MSHYRLLREIEFFSSTPGLQPFQHTTSNFAYGDVPVRLLFPNNPRTESFYKEKVVPYKLGTWEFFLDKLKQENSDWLGLSASIVMGTDDGDHHSMIIRTMKLEKRNFTFVHEDGVGEDDCDGLGQ